VTMASGDADHLGGRLALLAPAGLDTSQRRLYDELTARVLPEAAEGGFVARLDDGRFIGPFNALLRVPAVAAGLGEWTTQISRAGLADEVRQAVILTVGAAWSAEYEIEAHTSAARVAGLPDRAIDAILTGTPPTGLSDEANIAHRVTACLLTAHALADDLYQRAVATFGEAGLIAILCLIGQYQTISSILVCFQVPAPGHGHSPHK
jgi:4-carboxymuconolactone decarboxylase